ncbi:MAG: C40 family peptidase [Bacteroidales bacterium]|jgi:cell wall-associated NlpC family hydrolase|nr:C40 family peptidase [Bacteroidales bacterium]
MKKYLIAALTLALCGFCAVSCGNNGPKAIKDSVAEAADTLGSDSYGVARLSVINFNTGPSLHKESDSQALMGTPMKLIAKKNGWTLAVTPEGYESWVSSTSVAEMTKQELKDYLAKPKIIVISDYAKIYMDPDIKSMPVSDAVAGCILIDGGKHIKDFSKVEIADGRTGYIKSDKVEKFSEWMHKPLPSAENIISTAKRFMGVPYVWGGTSIKGVDCSGFTKSVYFLNGVILKRNAWQQAMTGTDVDISGYTNGGKYTLESLKNLKPGDLLFFGNKAANGKKEHVTHTAIYVGNGVFYQSSGHVRISSLIPSESNKYIKYKNLLCAKRILGNINNGKGIISVRNSVYAGLKEKARLEKHPGYEDGFGKN